MTTDRTMVSASPLCWPDLARLVDADRALLKELVRCYGAHALDWMNAPMHADPTVQGLAKEYRAAGAAYHAALAAARKETPQ
jgi:hypothetical protein